MASAHIPLGYHAMNSEANLFASEDDRLVRACHQSSSAEPEACGREPRRRAMTRRYALRDGFADFQVAHLRHSRWSHSGVWQRIFEALAQQAGNEYAMIGSTIVRAHQHGTGRKGGAASHRTQLRRAERQDSRGGGCTGPPDFISRQGRRTASKGPTCSWLKQRPKP